MVKDGDVCQTDPGSSAGKAQDLYWKILYRQLGSVDLVAIVLKKIVVKRDLPRLMKSLNAIKSRM
jgi:hypothetical protein